jgi:hypothetical protein
MQATENTTIYMTRRIAVTVRQRPRTRCFAEIPYARRLSVQGSAPLPAFIPWPALLWAVYGLRQLTGLGLPRTSLCSRTQTSRASPKRWSHSISHSGGGISHGSVGYSRQTTPAPPFGQKRRANGRRSSPRRNEQAFGVHVVNGDTGEWRPCLVSADHGNCASCAGSGLRSHFLFHWRKA